MGNCRPDITHQMLMMLLDSPLNKAGKLLIYIHTDTNVLIEVNPEIRIPRTFRRFCGLMVELLQRHKIRAAGANATLMKIVSSPVSKYLPPTGPKIGFSVSGEQTSLREFLPTLEKRSSNVPWTFVIGGVAHGDPVTMPQFGAEYCEKNVSISPYGLSAALCCAKLSHELEHVWGIS